MQASVSEVLRRLDRRLLEVFRANEKLGVSDSAIEHARQAISIAERAGNTAERRRRMVSVANAATTLAERRIALRRAQMQVQRVRFELKQAKQALISVRREREDLKIRRDRSRSLLESDKR